VPLDYDKLTEIREKIATEYGINTIALQNISYEKLQKQLLIIANLAKEIQDSEEGLHEIVLEKLFIKPNIKIHQTRWAEYIREYIANNKQPATSFIKSTTWLNGIEPLEVQIESGELVSKKERLLKISAELKIAFHDCLEGFGKNKTSCLNELAKKLNVEPKENSIIESVFGNEQNIRLLVNLCLTRAAKKNSYHGKSEAIFHLEKIRKKPEKPNRLNCFPNTYLIFCEAGLKS
jgi:hypothetical protein